MDPPPLPPLPTTPTSTPIPAATTTAVPAATAIHLNYPDSIDSSPRSRNNDTYDDPLPPVPGAKLRLMCSYGGHIIPRPHDKSLCYVGGDTRLVVVDRHSSLSSLGTRLSRSLLHGRSFTMKYQLPNEDLDSLVSITTEEDLENMIEEYDRLTSTSTSVSSTRIRLFLFFNKPETAASMGSLLDDAKSETWFVDALNGSGLLPRGLSDTTMDCLLNLDNDNDLEAPPEADHNREVKNVAHEVHYSMPDSPIVETSSSFGSSSSSPSMSNLPPIRVRVEDQKNGMEEKFAQMSFAHSGLQRQDDGLVVPSGIPPPIPVSLGSSGALTSLNHTVASNENSSRILSDDERSDHGNPVRLRKPPLPLQPVQHKAGTAYNLPSPDSVASDSSIASASSLSKPMYYQDQVVAAHRESRGPTSPNTSSEIPIPISQIQDQTYVLPPQSDQQQQQTHQQQQQQQQFAHASMHYIPHPATNPVPISSYYHQMYAPPPQQLHHPTDPQYPVYVMPVTQNQPFMSMQSNLVDTSTVVASSRPLTPPTPTVVAASAAYKDSIPPIYPTKTATQAKPEMPASVYRTAVTSTPALVQIPANQFQQQYVGYSQLQHPSQSIAVASGAAANYGYEYANPAHEQVYYASHQAAPLPSQYQSMSPAAAVAALADASKQMPADGTMQQIRTSQAL
ncbi:hypothetical protein Pint_16554 [Pistacia integerrima]|uniref:Uncharacterized protein n=1 Tax=Pistacia integerrima TaxID=434235 RepID=A0ACC0ZFK9_9ROSI|nr:hypothetical protein Pint_16554 [Pistacia integerrima]